MKVINTYIVIGWVIGAKGELTYSGSTYLKELYECEGGLWVFESQVITQKDAKQMIENSKQQLSI